MAKEQAILEIVVDESDLLKSAAGSKKALLDLKDEQKELNAELKKGAIDTDEFAKKSVVLEQRIRKEADTYKNLTKAINTNANSLDGMRLRLSQLDKQRASIDRSNAKQIKDYDRLTKEINELNAAISKEEQKVGQFSRNVGNYGAKFAEAAQNINVAGVSVGSLTQQFSSFLNPATAALGVVTALGSAYGRSTIGAKDLEFAQNQLAIATNLASNAFARFISSTEDGEGIVSQFVNTALTNILGADRAAVTKFLTQLGEDLEDLGRKEIEVRDEVNQRLEENQEILTELQSDQIDYNEKISKTNSIITNLRTNQEALVGVLTEQLKILEIQLGADKENEELQTTVLEKRREISNVNRDAEKRVQAIVRLEQNLTEEYKKQQAILDYNAKRTGRTGTVGQVRQRTGEDFLLDTGVAKKDETGTFIEGPDPREKVESDYTKFLADEATKRIQISNAVAEARKEAFRQELHLAQVVFAGIAAVMDEGTKLQKTFALTSIAIDTAEAIAALTAASEENPANAFTFGGAAIAQYASGITRILANIAQAKELISGFAEGGWTGPGNKYDVAGVVHRDEYVTPKHIVHNPMAKPHLQALEKMRTGYADGGFVTSEITSPSQQNAMLMSAIRELPAPEVSVKEITRAQNRVRNREAATSLKP